jgi:uncharacterized protein
VVAERIEFVDALRGFALLGILGLNLSLFWGNDFLSDEQRASLPLAGVSAVFGALLRLLVENKFLGLFAFLFGISFSLQLRSAEARGADGGPTFRRRVFWLFAFGAAHGWLLWWGDVLRFYALWGLLLPVFVGRRERTVLAAGVFFSVVAPALVVLLRHGAPSIGSAGPDLSESVLSAFSRGSYREMLAMNWAFDWQLSGSIGQAGYQLAILGRLLLGVWAGRTGLFHDLDRSRGRLERMLVLGLVTGVVGSLSFAAGLGRRVAESSSAVVLAPLVRVLDEAGFLGLTLAYACGLALFYRTPAGKRRLARLAPVGRMALTNYLVQTLVGLWLFYGFMPGPHLMAKVGLVVILPAWIVVYALQVTASERWLRHFRFGPAEWLWRSLTYWSVLPIRRASG